MTKWEQIKHKLVSQEEAKTIISSWKADDKKVVFTNGCFDILHLGHVTYLAKAASLGDFLIVGINADESVKKQKKGPLRPINNETSRALVIASLEAVDLVIIFKHDTPKSLIEYIIPSILVKGGDYDVSEEDSYSKSYIVGSKFIKENGGKVITIPLEDGYSTTKIINKINQK